jgi:hypothetical protein
MLPQRKRPAIAASVAQRMACRLIDVRLPCDVHERAADWSLSLPITRRRADRLQRIREAGILFIHVPKCAGMAVSNALYGCQVKHATIRWYRQRCDTLARLPSFAVLRDPVERFVSAYRYAKGGGGAHNRVSPIFYDQYRNFRGIDEAIDHVESAPTPYGVDHIFRPQHWFVECRSGKIAVDRFFSIDDPELAELVRTHSDRTIETLNQSMTPKIETTASQAERIRRLYRRDMEIYATLR